MLSTPGHLIGLGVGHLPLPVAFREGRAQTQRGLARFVAKLPRVIADLDRMVSAGSPAREPDAADADPRGGRPAPG